MVEIKEIRQGNYVKYADHKYWNPDIRSELVQVDSDIYREIDSNPHLYDLVELTPELILGCGFKKKMKRYCIFNNIIMSHYIHEAVCLFFNEPEESDYSTIYSYLGGFGFTDFKGTYYAATFKWIHYLHEVQNLFKELNHKELTVNL